MKEQKNILKPTYTQNNIFQNFLSNKSPKEENNNEIPKSINILSNISKNTNNNNIGNLDILSVMDLFKIIIYLFAFSKREIIFASSLL